MHQTDQHFFDALRKSHTTISKAELYRGNELLMEDVPLIGGTLTDDSQAIIRRRVSLSISATDEVLAALPSAVPEKGGLWPVGNELRLYSGISIPATPQYAAHDHLLGVGVFRIAKPVIDETPEGITISLEGYDRSRAVSRARFTEPYVVGSGTNYATAIKNLISSRLPTLDLDNDFQFMDTTYTTPQLVFTSDDDPMQMAINMATSIGAELFFDGHGTCTLQPEPNPLYDEPDMVYSDTEAILTAVHRDLDDEQAYNGVIIVSENSELDAPIRSEAWDTNKLSPTYYDPDYPSDSLYGPVPYFINTQYITTQQQADDAAVANLSRILGIIEDVSFETIANPAHQSGDIIQIESPRSNVTGVNILDSLTMNFGAAGVTMSGVTRKRSIV